MTDAAPPNREQVKHVERQDRVRHVLDHYLAERAAGKDVSQHELLARHADLHDELAAELKKLELVDRARLQAATSGTSNRNADSTEHPTVRLVRCPHCRTGVEVDDAWPPPQVHCQACGLDFHLIALEDDQPPTQVGRFELIEVLGAGSFGTVWRARDTTLDREVAVKIPRHSVADPLEVAEVMHEARVAAQLRHRHIVTVHEVGSDDDRVYIVSDLIRGLPLDAWLRREPMTFRVAADLCRQIALALEHAHQAGVTHRDLKPANIIVDEAGEPHLTDFGLAKHVTDHVAMTMDGHILGTPAYMSPEQARGQASACDARSDVYSLGVVLFQMLTDELPFRGNMSVLPHKVVHDDPPSPRRFNRYVPRDLETICLKCLQKSPHQRYQRAERLADDLQNWLDGMPIQARPVGRAEYVWRWCRRRPLAAGFAASLLAALLLMTLSLLIFVPIWQARLGASIHDIRKLSDGVLRDLKTNVVAAADAAARNPQLIAELEQEFRPDSPPDNEAMQRFLSDRNHHSQQSIDIVNWFLLDRFGSLRASSDPTAGGRVIGERFVDRDYFYGAQQGVAKVFTPYLSHNDSHYKVPTAAQIIVDGRMIGVLVVSVSTPGTKALDNQRSFIRNLSLAAGVSFAPLALFLLAVALGPQWPRIKRAAAVGRTVHPTTARR